MDHFLASPFCHPSVKKHYIRVLSTKFLYDKTVCLFGCIVFSPFCHPSVKKHYIQLSNKMLYDKTVFFIVSSFVIFKQATINKPIFLRLYPNTKECTPATKQEVVLWVSTRRPSLAELCSRLDSWSLASSPSSSIDAARRQRADTHSSNLNGLWFLGSLCGYF